MNANLRTLGYQAVRERLDAQNLIKYLVVYNMSKTNLAKRFGVSISFIGRLIKEHNIDLNKEKADYYHEHFKKIQASGTGEKVRNHKPRKAFAVYK